MRALAGLVAACLPRGPVGLQRQLRRRSDIPSTIGPQSSLPESKGFRCDDPKGDIGVGRARASAPLTEPAGIDMVVAEAKVDGDALAVTYTMAGPISLGARAVRRPAPG